VDHAMAGQNVDVALSNVQLSSLYAGCVLCDPEAPVVVGQAFVGQIITFADMPMLRGQHVRILNITTFNFVFLFILCGFGMCIFYILFRCISD
jgi:hypothetical protein